MPSTPWLTISLRVNTETLVQDCSCGTIRRQQILNGWPYSNTRCVKNTKLCHAGQDLIYVNVFLVFTQLALKLTEENFCFADGSIC